VIAEDRDARLGKTANELRHAADVEDGRVDVVAGEDDHVRLQAMHQRGDVLEDATRCREPGVDVADLHDA